MERPHLPHTWSLAVDSVRPHRPHIVIGSDISARNTLLETVRAAAYNQDLVHGASLCDGVVPVIPLLQSLGLLGGHKRLLRGICDCILLQLDMRLHRARLASAEAVLPQHYSEAVDLAGDMVSAVLWRGERMLEDATKRPDVVQREFQLDQMRYSLTRSGYLGCNLPVLLYPRGHDHNRTHYPIL